MISIIEEYVMGQFMFNPAFDYFFLQPDVQPTIPPEHTLTTQDIIDTFTTQDITDINSAFRDIGAFFVGYEDLCD